MLQRLYCKLLKDGDLAVCYFVSLCHILLSAYAAIISFVPESNPGLMQGRWNLSPLQLGELRLREVPGSPRVTQPTRSTAVNGPSLLAAGPISLCMPLPPLGPCAKLGPGEAFRDASRMSEGPSGLGCTLPGVSLLCLAQGGTDTELVDTLVQSLPLTLTFQRHSAHLSPWTP